MSIFEKLNVINVNDKTEQKNGLTYLSWAWAWGEVKKLFPNANYTIYENANGLIYHTDGKTCWVKTGVTIEGLEHIEYLPIMDYRNKSIPVDNVTSFDVNKAIQRSLTKAVARHGLGLYIYAGEDLPESKEKAKGYEVPEEEIWHPSSESKNSTKAEEKSEDKASVQAEEKSPYICDICGKVMSESLYNKSVRTYNLAICSKECKEDAIKQGRLRG